MPKASPIQPSFSGGEFSPRVYGRVDNERYKTGAAKLENYLPTVQGPILRRPGMKYSGADAKDPSKPPEFLEFKFSQTQNYILEFGDKYVRFFTNNTRITVNTTVVSGAFYSAAFNSSFPTYALRSFSGARPGETQNGALAPVSSGVLELVSPYSYPDVQNLKFSQKEDTLILTCSTYPTYKLIRYGNLSWELVRFVTQDGPYLPLNSYKFTGDNLDTTIELGAPSTIPAVLGTGPVLYSASTGPLVGCSSMVDNGSGLIRVHTRENHRYVSGNKVVILGVAGTVEANNGTSSVTALSWPVTKVTDTSFDLQGSTFTNAYTGSGFVYPAMWESLAGAVVTLQDVGRAVGLYGSNGNRIWGKITRVHDAARVVIATDPSQPLAIGGTSVFWQLGTFFLNNHPSCSCFHQDRLGLSGAPQFPNRVDLSVTSEYENFATSNSSLVVADNNAISFGLNANQINKVNWLKSDTQGLLAGSFSYEWNITPNNQAAALTPTNINAKQTSFFGSHDADAIQTGNATLYLQRAQRRVREMNYFFQVDTYRSTDIAELADHLMLPGLTKLSNQQESIPIVWALTTEGKIRSMTYSRDDASLKVGWAPHTLGGQSDSAGTAPVVKSMAVIPSPDGTYDQLWCANQRYINGTSVLSIEYMTEVFDDNVAQEDAICLDMAGTYDSPVTITNITRAGSAVVTAASHGFVDGDEVLVKKVLGVSSSFVDAMGVTFNSNLVNARLFRVGSTTANNFFLQDIINGSSYVDSRAYSAYFSGGEARKMVSTISGLTWLKNETVSVWADGKTHPNVTVNSGGAFTLDYKAAVVHVGYGYNSDGKTLRPEAGSADGSSIGKLRRPYRAAFMVHRSGELQVGRNFETLAPVQYETFDPPQADVATPLFSGIAREFLANEHDFDGQVCFRMNTPAPGMIQAVTVMLEENDV